RWMISYRYMYMRMDGNMDGAASLSPQDVRDAGYMAVPTDMDMHMHMFGAMFAPLDVLTIGLMLPVQHMSMHHVGGMPLGAMEFDTMSAGVGDIRLSPLVRLFESHQHQLLVGAGILIPSGATHVRGDTPAGAQVRLPYPMRPGGGSVGALPSLTYTGSTGIVSWGAQVRARLPLHDNEDGYRLGFEYGGSAWGAVQALPWLQVSARSSVDRRENISGSDPDLNPRMVPTANPDNQAFTRVRAFVGVGLTAPDTILEEHRLAIEAGLPLYQYVDGPQLGERFQLMAGWQWSPE
ncbi:MAG: transporter, partial [Gammaproteobacteria bacterium]|nr:transporter [Gammaproteobacteria bacterium]NIR82605.1 transporter [Gammaproteobacteria bacterium]NIR88804.1 transporter [Gammaproteobacteria bacterium]NIU03716.1 transporter [Gammaproteobacteria bacterium]NIV51043.1 transporter [Gammaproteobacteria bacterium]